MKADVPLMNLKDEAGKTIILRNLRRILDIRIVEIDVENGRLVFLYSSPRTFQIVKQELLRIGYPMLSCIYPKSNLPTYYSVDTEKLEKIAR